MPPDEEYSVEFTKTHSNFFLDWLKKLFQFFWFLPKRIYNTYLLVRHREFKQPASKNVCPMRYLNPFVYLNYSTYIAAKSIMIKAILKYPRKDPEKGIFDDQDNALVFLPIFKDLYPEETITPENFLLTCSKENIRKYRQPILRFIGPQHIEKRSEELQAVIEDTIQFYCSECNLINATEFSFTLAVAVVSRLLLNHLGPFEAYRKIAIAVDTMNRSVMKKALKQPLSNEEKEEYKHSIQVIRSAIDTSFYREEKSTDESFIHFLREEKQLTPIEIKLSLFSMYFAGSDTTSGLLNYLLWQLGKHPEIQEKIYQEIHSSQENLFTYANHSLTINQLFSESMRLYTPTYVIGRIAACPLLCTVKDKAGNTVFKRKLRKNEKLLSMPTFAARDPLIFENPDQFNPQRFPAALKSYSWFAFGDGTHACPGQWLARAEISLFVALLVKKYKFSSSPENEFQQLGYISLKSSENVTLHLFSRN
jgi:cytochrome P450